MSTTIFEHVQYISDIFLQAGYIETNNDINDEAICTACLGILQTKIQEQVVGNVS